MAYVNIHSIPGVTVAITYWNAATPITSPVHPLSYGLGVYSQSAPQTEWDRAVFEITSFGTGILPLSGKITIAAAYVGGPYDGLIGIASGTTFGSTIAQQTFAADALYSGSKSSPMDATNRFFIFGHNSGSGPDIQNLASLRLEFDGTFTAPAFWTDFQNTYEDTELHRPLESTIIPEVLGQEAIAGGTACHSVPDPPGPGLGGYADPPGPGDAPPPLDIVYPICLVMRDLDYPPNGLKYCCRYVEGGPIICVPY